MKRELKSVILIKIFLILLSYFFVVSSAVSIAQDFNDVPDELIVATYIPTKSMTISYHGQSSNDGPMFKSGAKESNYFATVVGTPKMPVFTTNENLTGVGKRIKAITTYVLKYVLIDDDNLEESISQFGSKSKIKANIDTPDEYDMNLSFNIGYNDETQNMTLNAIKLSSYFLSTHLDAVYDYNSNGVDFFLSNAVINTYLINGMTLEFQISPKNSIGALLLSMQF